MKIDLREKNLIGKIISILVDGISVGEFCAAVKCTGKCYAEYLAGVQFPSFAEMQRILDLSKVTYAPHRESVLHLHYLHTNLLAVNTRDIDMVSIKDNLPPRIYTHALINAVRDSGVKV